MKTTEKDFEKFKQYCRWWIEVFGLKDYHVTFYHVESSSAQYGAASTDSFRRTARVKLMKDWGKDAGVTEEELNRTALHEILHVVLNQVMALGESRYLDRDAYSAAEEAVVFRLENGIFSMRGKAR